MKQSTLVILLSISLLLIFLFSFPSCGDPDKQKALKSQVNHTLELREAGGSLLDGYLYIIKDKETGREYILVRNGQGVAITPRLPQ